MSQDILKSENPPVSEESMNTSAPPEEDHLCENEEIELDDLLGKSLKKPFLPAWLRDRKYLGFCFLLPALIVFCVYAGRGVYPFGDNSVLVLDLNAQYVYFYSYLRNVFAEGHSLVYSFTTALSGEFMGTFAYYVASPFAWLTLLFPADHITEALYLIFVLKAGCCGLTFGWYLDQHGHRNHLTTIAFSVMYALCSYGIVMMHNSMWIDCMLLLPLVIRGLESLVTDHKYKLFILSVAQCILTSFYIGYMIVLFVIVYYFYLYFTQEPSTFNPTGDKYHFLKTTVRVALCGLLAVGLAAIIILPAYTSLQFGKTDFTNPDWGFGQKFDFLDLLTKLFFGSYDTVRPAGLPFLFAGMLMTILAPVYFFIPSISVREKAASGVLLVVMILSFNTSFLDLIWHGFQFPNWLNYRYAFTLVFFLLVLAARALEHIREIPFKFVALSCAFLLVLLFVFQKLDFENVRDYETVWASAAFIVIFMLVLRAISLPKESLNRTASAMLLFVVLMEMTCSTVYDLICLDEDVVFSSRKGFVEFNARMEPAVQQLLEDDPSFYRFEKTPIRRTCDNMYLNIRGLSNSTSTMNQSVIDFLGQMGMAAHSNWTKYRGASPFLNSLTGIKYVLGTKIDALPDYYIAGKSFATEGQPNDVIIYENPYVLSLAFGVSPEILKMDEIVETKFNDDGSVKETITLFDSFLSPYPRTSELSQYMLGDLDLPDMFYPGTILTTTTTNLSTLNVVEHRGYKLTDASREGSLTYQVRIDSEDPLYIYLPSDYPRECTVYVNGVQKDTIGGDDTNIMLNLGSYPVGDTISVKVALKESNLYLKVGGTIFYYYNEEAFLDQIQQLRSSSQFVIDSYSDTHFEGTLDVAEGRTFIFTSLPYDSGWKITVDGKEVPTVKILGTLLGFETTPGAHTLEMNYRPTCLILGASISIISLLGFVALCVLESLQKKKYQNPESPVSEDHDSDTMNKETASISEEVTQI